jgi:hypothetical protein
MLNLAFIGFTITGILFLIYSASFLWFKGKNRSSEVNAFAIAFLFLGITFSMWGLVAGFYNEYMGDSILLGNALLLASTICLLSIVFNKNKMKSLALLTATFLSLFFLLYRWKYAFPEPVLTDGVLIFKTQFQISIVWMAIFLLVWFPACLKMARLNTSRLKMKDMLFPFQFVYGISILSAILFMSASTVNSVIIFFTILNICFLMLLASNILLIKESK